MLGTSLYHMDQEETKDVNQDFRSKYSKDSNQQESTESWGEFADEKNWIGAIKFFFGTALSIGLIVLFVITILFLFTEDIDLHRVANVLITILGVFYYYEVYNDKKLKSVGYMIVGAVAGLLGLAISGWLVLFFSAFLTTRKKGATGMEVSVKIVSVFLCLGLVWIFTNEKTVNIECVEVEGGRFGREIYTEAQRNQVQEVEINDFYIGKYPVTQDQYVELMSGIITGIRNPAFFNEANHFNLRSDSGRRPVECVSWYDAITFANRLSKQEGLPPAYNVKGEFLDAQGNVTVDISKVEGFRLPMEVEWEYAARGGKPAIAEQTFEQEYAGSNKLILVGWYFLNSSEANSELGSWEKHELTEGFTVSEAFMKALTRNKGTMPVGEKEPNELGIYDMTGNVQEWCHDLFCTSESNQEHEIKENVSAHQRQNYRVIRGGSWLNFSSDCTVSERTGCNASSIEPFIGFRIVRTKPSP